jgi:hypothetical protein
MHHLRWDRYSGLSVAGRFVIVDGTCMDYAGQISTGCKTALIKNNLYHTLINKLLGMTNAKSTSRNT